MIVNIRNCDGAWCLVDGEGFKGYLEQVKLWASTPTKESNEVERTLNA